MSGTSAGAARTNSCVRTPPPYHSNTVVCWAPDDTAALPYLLAAGAVRPLTQASTNGSPAHPSYPAGHAVQNGAFATVLKVN